MTVRRGNWRRYEQDELAELDDWHPDDYAHLDVVDTVKVGRDPLDVDELDAGRSTIWDGRAEDELARDGRTRVGDRSWLDG